MQAQLKPDRDLEDDPWLWMFARLAPGATRADVHRELVALMRALGLTASLVLRCNDCVDYHILQCVDAGWSDAEIYDALNVGLVIGGSIVIPHLRHAVESLDLARRFRQSATANTEEAERFITDSQALVYIAQAWRHKVVAAIHKRCLQAHDHPQRREFFVRHMEDSVAVYEKLVALTDKTYINATDMLMRLNLPAGVDIEIKI